MMMSEILSAAAQPFWSAELDYRRERAIRSYGTGRRPRRRWLSRRPTLKLPQQRPRPAVVA
jgi:hypothetical protein